MEDLLTAGCFLPAALKSRMAKAADSGASLSADVLKKIEVRL